MRSAHLVLVCVFDNAGNVCHGHLDEVVVLHDTDVGPQRGERVRSNLEKIFY